MNTNPIRGYAQQPYKSDDVVEYRPGGGQAFPGQWNALRKCHHAGNTPVSIVRTHGHHVSNQARTGLLRGATALQRDDGTHVTNLETMMAAIRRERYPALQAALIGSAVPRYYSDALVSEEHLAELFKFVVQQAKRQRGLREEAETISAFFSHPAATLARAAPVFARAMHLADKLSNTEKCHFYRRLSHNLRCVPVTDRIAFVDEFRRLAGTMTEEARAAYILPLVHNLDVVPDTRKPALIDDAIFLMNRVSVNASVPLAVALIENLDFMPEQRDQQVVNDVLALTAPRPDDPLPDGARTACYQTLLENLDCVPIEQRGDVVDRAMTLLTPDGAVSGDACRAFLKKRWWVPANRLNALYQAFPHSGKLRGHYWRLYAFADVWERAGECDIAPMGQSIMSQSRVYLGKARLPILRLLLDGAEATLLANDPSPNRRNALCAIIPCIRDEIEALQNAGA